MLTIDYLARWHALLLCAGRLGGAALECGEPVNRATRLAALGLQLAARMYDCESLVVKSNNAGALDATCLLLTPLSESASAT